MTREEVVRQILPAPSAPTRTEGSAYAPANIALCKYWGKRDRELNLPVTSSLSVSLGELGTHTTVTLATGSDRVSLDDAEIDPEAPFARRLSGYLDLFRTAAAPAFDVRTRNTVPTAAGLASSASGFAALVLALQDLFGWSLERPQLSILARLGSGSACRSVYEGFVEWSAGSAADGMDSFAAPLPETWPELRLGVLELATDAKPIGSRDAMNRTVEESPLYRSWPDKVATDLAAIKRAIGERNFAAMGAVAESNALTMHATMLAAAPPILYFIPETVAAMRRAWALRADGLPVYVTMDAGPNVKLLYLEDNEPGVRAAFPEMTTVAPWATP